MHQSPVHTGVYPNEPPSSFALSGSPRTYGGIPADIADALSGAEIAPYMRGYSRDDGPSRFLATVVPIQARVFLQFARRERIVHRCPRASGAIPERGGTHTEARQLSPRVRGCSDILHQRTAETEVLPVHAGVFRFCCWHTVTCRGCPRTGGGIPEPEQHGFMLERLARTYGNIPIQPSQHTDHAVRHAEARMLPQRESLDRRASQLPRAGRDVRHADIGRGDACGSRWCNEFPCARSLLGAYRG